MRFSCQARRGCFLVALILLSLIPWDSATGQEATVAGNRQYRAAAELQRSGQFELAVAAWSDFLDKNKDHGDVPVATLNLGICYLKSKQYDKAFATLNRVLQKYPKHAFRDAALLYLGVTQFSLGRAGQGEQYTEAMRTLDQLLRDYPKGRYLPQALYYRAECDYALGNKQGAAKLYDRLVKEFPKDRLLPEALYALGVAQEELGQYQAAGATYDRFLQTATGHPLSIEVAMRRGETFFGVGQYRQAIKWFAKATEEQDFRLADHALMRQAACLAQLRQYDKAADLYASLATRFPKSSRVEAANLAAGKCYYLANNWAKSRSVLTKVIAARGSSLPEATHWSARSLLKQNQPDKAVALLEETLSEVGGSPMEAQLRLDLADATYEMPNLRNISITLYTDVVKKFPTSPVADSALYMAAFTALQLEDYKAAMTCAEQFFETYATSNLLPDVLAIAAESELQLGKSAEAQRRYQDLVRRYPNHAEAPSWQLRRALILYMEKQYPQAIDAVKPILSRLRSKAAQAEAYYLLGSSLVQEGQFDAAIGALESSLRIDSDSQQADDAMVVLADALRQKGDNARAIAVIRRLIATFPKSPLLDQAHYWLAELAYNAGDLTAAISAYEDMIRTWPKSSLVPQALFGLGWAQLAEKQYVAAQKTLDQLIAEFPKDDLIPQARFARGTTRQQLGQFAPAIEDVQALLATKPSGKEKLDALYVLGLCQAGLKKHEDAIATFEALLSEDPKYSGSDNTLNELAWALIATGKKREAAQRFSELARMHPNSRLAAESLFHAAELEYDRKNYIVALTTYRDVARKTTDQFLKEKALHKLAWSYFNMKQYEKAHEAFAAQQKDFPKGKLLVDAAFMEGESFTKLGQFDKALAAYEKMLAMPTKPSTNDFLAVAILHAGQAAGQLKQWEKSLKILSQASEELKDSAYLPEILFEQAHALEKLGRLDEAATIYAAVPGKTSQEVAARAQFMLGELLFREKKHAEAIRIFYEVIYGGYDYPKWQAYATYEAARCFEVLKNKDQAIKLYKELVTKYPQSDKTAAAKRRLESLEQ